ncbi:phage baseplate assembly protein V [Ketobacter alkanivorans]|uniref:VgrG protein n=1 Tax=Ketobacter alkanivorans TaxID=1917421 RepID=A0A2K9LLB0_9GAMM|nr:phage baseplate assembly protein V [Ketobacter alkanivorans]AUM13118.1 VgrG protein [Ketobacter alkanivorans]
MNSHVLGHLHSMQLAQVTDNADPDNRGRVKIRLQSAPMEMWASVVAPSAGQGYGASFIPRLDEIVVVAFINQDTPLVMGSIWCGNGSRPEDADPQEQHYVVRTPNDTVLEFDDSDPKVELRTRSGYHITITEGGGGEVKIERGSQSVTMTASDITVDSAGPVNINAATVNVSASMVQVDAGMSRFSGVVQCDTIIATSVVGTTYTPGAGNIW